MRLPATKVWRAFPEFDSFDDERCRRYLREARARNYRSGCVLSMLGFAAAIVFLVVTGVAADALAERLPEEPKYDRVATAITLGLALFWLAGLTAGVLFGRDKWLRAAIRNRLETMRCLGCRYSLLGLAPIGPEGVEHVICPECGKRIELTPEMLGQLRVLGPGAATPSKPSSP